MCYYEDEYWPSRYHDYIPDPSQLKPQPKTPEVSFEDFLKHCEDHKEELLKNSGWKNIDFQF